MFVVFRKSFFVFILLIFFFHYEAFSQNANRKSDPIEILNSDIYRFKKVGNRNVKMFSGKVRIKQGQMFIRCDSLIEYSNPSFMKMYRSVKVKYDSETNVSCDYMEYYPATGKSIFKGGVKLDKEGSVLTTTEAFYDKQTDLFRYNRFGTFKRQTSVLYSDRGIYNGATKLSSFYGNVRLIDSNINLTSDSLKYDAKKKHLILISPATIKQGTRTLIASSGYLSDSIGPTKLTNRAYVYDSSFYAIADTIIQFKQDKITYLLGKGMIFDSLNNIKITGDSIRIDDRLGEFSASLNPLVYYYRKDKIEPLVVRADHIYSTRYINDPKATELFSPIILNRKSSAKKNTLPTLATTSEEPMKDSLLGSNRDIEDFAQQTDLEANAIIREEEDSLITYTDRYLVAYNNVRLYSDSLQVVCDSVYYSSVDSVIRLNRNPIIWVNDYQITGDSIYVHRKERSFDIIHVPSKSFILNQEFDSLYSQARSKTLSYFATPNNKDSIILKTNVKMAYFIKDSADFYISYDVSSADRAAIQLTEDKTMETVKFFNNYVGVHYPPDKIPESVLYIEGFKDYQTLSPSSVEYVETFIDTIQSKDSIVVSQVAKKTRESSIQFREKKDSSFLVQEPPQDSLLNNVSQERNSNMPLDTESSILTPLPKKE